jgi:hypothetical protein
MGKMKREQDHWSESPNAELLHHIGRVAWNFSNVEMASALGVWGLLGIDQQRGVHITSGMQFKTLLDLFSRLAGEYAISTGDTALAEDIASIRKRLSKAADDRNMILHSSWLPAGDGANPTRLKPWRKPPYDEEFPIANVKAVADEIASAFTCQVLIIERLPHIGPPPTGLFS